jgi:hypothetical protein
MLRRTLVLLSFVVAQVSAQRPNPNPVPNDPSPWPQHSLTRPQPPIVTPAPAGAPVPPPSDATVLFDGASLDGWVKGDSSGQPAGWRLVDGAMEVTPGSGSIMTRQGFGDMQLHVEWRTPAEVKGEGQERGNSGVFLMHTYEVQVLDSHGNATYPDGQAGAIYGEYPPLVNASRGPGVWQTYDIVFRRPRFDRCGKVLHPAHVTVFHNGVLVQDHTPVIGPTSNGVRTPYTAHADRLPLALQDHGVTVRYRDIWVRPLAEDPSPADSATARC